MPTTIQTGTGNVALASPEQVRSRLSGILSPMGRRDRRESLVNALQGTWKTPQGLLLHIKEQLNWDNDKSWSEKLGAIFAAYFKDVNKGDEEFKRFENSILFK